MAIHEKLKNMLLLAGLSEAEVIVYLELLQKPSQTKWELVARTGLNRNKIYRAFDKLRDLQMIDRNPDGIKALSLKALVSHLTNSQRKFGKLADNIKNIAPYLRIPHEAVEEFDIAYTHDQILENYMKMSEVNYDTCLDFGDLENFVQVLGGIKPAFKFREKRFKQFAKNKAICTTVGPYTSCMSREDDMNKFQSNIDFLKIDFKGKWLIFSDTNDYVMFNDCADIENPSSVVIRSKVVADAQRLQFSQFSHILDKL